MSRLARPIAVNCYSSRRPFSNFDFVEDHFGGSIAIRRLFSLARSKSRDFASIVVEEVPPEGAVADENSELAKLYSDYECRGVKRLSFWRSPMAGAEDLVQASASDCLGWAIVKWDRATIPHRPAVGGRPDRPTKLIDGWHVFESVMVKYDHHHNYVPEAPEFAVQLGHRSEPVHVKGWIFSQQNGLNKCCAHVAIRTLATAFFSDPDITFSRLNSLIPPDASQPPDWLPGDGLLPSQIAAVLKSLGVPFDHICYPEHSDPDATRRQLPYPRLLYSGAETGAGALLAFSLDGPDAVGAHIIPVFGHTFNEDTWAPRGEGAYFRVGERIAYIPSESWVSSFLVHDDNFGSEFCLPKRFVRRSHVYYVVALRPRGFAYGGLNAEVVGSRFFYTVLPRLISTNHRWLNRVLETVSRRELILRTVPLNRAAYLEHLARIEDWKQVRENPAVIDLLAPRLPERMWMIEVSVPDLFSTNLRKIGELLLAADRPLDPKAFATSYVLARFPGRYFLPAGYAEDGSPQFQIAPSSIDSHTELLVRR